jgi:hypothetical protein
MGSIRGRAGFVSVAVSLAALATMLLTASSASAAIGISKSFVPQNRPGLVSVTAQGNTGLVNFCFQTSGGQAITPPFNGETAVYDPSNFILGGYDESFQQQAATAEQLNNNCVQATFATGQITAYTIGTVNADAVVAIIAGNPVGNLADSAPLIGSDIHNGTRNFTSGLDLVNVTSPGSNRLAFVFDQNVRTEDLPPGCPPACSTEDFLFYDGAGQLHGAFFGNQVVAITDNVVVIQYQNPPDAVGDARIGLVRHRACVSGLVNGGGQFVAQQFGCGTPLRADTPFGGSNRTSLGSAPVAGAPGAGNTALIEATGAALVNNGNSNQINFTFETNVALGDSAPSCFTATTSNNRRLFGDSASVNGNVVTVTFNGMQDFSEMIVRAGIQSPDVGFPALRIQPQGVFVQQPDCVQSPTGAIGNTMGSQAVGGNVGAFATGYTTAPDAIGLTVNGGDVTVPVDQRVDPATINLADVILLDNQGNPIGAPPSSAAVFGNGSPNDPHSVVFTYDPVAAGAAAGMQLLPGALSSFGTPGVDEFDFEPNVVQVFAK